MMAASSGVTLLPIVEEAAVDAAEDVREKEIADGVEE